jgi:peptide/nickel transport system permease protein
LGLKNKQNNSKKETYYAASQGKLIWWKFKRHKLALISIPFLVILYLGAIFAEFLSPYIPSKVYSDYRSAPPQVIRIYDEEGGFQAPFVYEIERVMDEKTFARTYILNKDIKYPVKFFTRGEPYKFWGVFRADIHLITSSGPMFLIGTDELGRDMLTRVLYGSRISLTIGLISVIFTFIIGVTLGAISGYFGGIIDDFIQRFIEILMSIPAIPLWMTFSAALPRNWSSLQIYFAIIIVMSLITWTGLARVVRGKLMSLLDEDFVIAARIAGAKDFYIMFRHLIPTMTSYIIVYLTLSVPGTIIGEAVLSFLGLGIKPPIVSWGVLLQNVHNLKAIAFQPWLLLPIAWIIVTVLMFNFLGDGLRDSADPYKNY